MILSDDIINKIKRITNVYSSNFDENIISFFADEIKNYSSREIPSIISAIVKRESKKDLYKHANRNTETKTTMLGCCSSAIKEFNYSIDKEELYNYFELFNLYLNLTCKLNNETLDILMEKFNDLLNQNLIDNPNVIIETLVNFIKYISYEYEDDEEKTKEITQSKYFSILESIITKYIEGLKVSHESINDQLLLIVMESRNFPGFTNINNLLVNMGNDDLNKYDNLIRNDVLINESEYNSFFKSIISYKLKNSILPEYVCIYLYRHFMDNKNLVRIANMDMIQNYLVKNGLEDAVCFNDPLYPYGGGAAGTKSLSVRDNDLDMKPFHEATHMIQFNDFKNNRNFFRYRYDMLKDYIIMHNIPPEDYRRKNHDRFLFEVDADIQGERLSNNILLNVYEKDREHFIERLNELPNLEEQRLRGTKTLFLNGQEVDKKQLFDSIIREKPEYLNKYPVLLIEYNIDGSKKTREEILDTLEIYRLNNTYSEEELNSIGNCIFGDTLEVEQTMI